MSDKPSPLEGIKVLDLTQAMAGPFATMLLGDLGSNVIKIEPPGGDQTRKWAPPFLNGMSSYFLSANKNKRSMVMDLKKSEGVETLLHLVSDSDVIIENFRPGVMEKLGLDYNNVRVSNRDIIYCSLSGYGQTGPYSDYPGYDLTLLSYSGLLSITGEKDRPPVKFGVPIADIVSGLFASNSIIAALFYRNNGGGGQFIDLSMNDANLSVLTHQAMSYMATQENPEKLGSAHSSIAPYQVFSTRDGYAAICVGTEKLWKQFTESLEIQRLQEHLKFRNNVQRVRNREELAEEINRETVKLNTSELIEKLKASGIPCAPINSVEDALNSEQTKNREMVTDVESPYGILKLLGSPFRMSESPGRITRAPPMLGEHTMEILKEFNVGTDEIRSLIKGGVVNTRVLKDQDL